MRNHNNGSRKMFSTSTWKGWGWCVERKWHVERYSTAYWTSLGRPNVACAVVGRGHIHVWKGNGIILWTSHEPGARSFYFVWINENLILWAELWIPWRIHVYIRALITVRIYPYGPNGEKSKVFVALWVLYPHQAVTYCLLGPNSEIRTASGNFSSAFLISINCGFDDGL